MFAELHKIIPCYSFTCCVLGIIHLRPSAHRVGSDGWEFHVSFLLPMGANGWLCRGWGQSGKQLLTVQEDLQPTTVVTALKKVKVARRTQQEKFI